MLPYNNKLSITKKRTKMNRPPFCMMTCSIISFYLSAIS